MKKIDEVAETIVSTEKYKDVILVFTQHGIYVTGDGVAVSRFVNKYGGVEKK